MGRISVLCLNDPGRRDGGGRLRDNLLIDGVLAELGAVDIFCFDEVLEPRPNVTSLPPGGPLAMARAAARHRLALSGRYDFTRFSGITETVARADLVYASMPYALDFVLRCDRGGPLVWDTHNVDTDVWEVRRRHSSWPMTWVYGREQHIADGLVRAGLRQSDLVLACTPEDQRALSAVDPHANLALVPNALDFTRYASRNLSAEVDTDGGPCVAIIGSFRQPNPMDGMRWFAHDIWPAVLQQLPSARLRLIGRRPRNDADLQLLEALPRVDTRFDVPSIPDALSGAAAIALPERRGTGSKLKAVEALGSGLPVVTTSVGMMGLAPVPHHASIVDDADGFVAAVVATLSTPTPPDDDDVATFRQQYGNESAQRRFRQELRTLGYRGRGP